MIERVIELSVRHRTLVSVAGVLLALAGAYAIVRTPIDAIPDLSENQVIVFTDWPGHSPREIEDQVTYPLSLSLRGMDGVSAVRSSSDFNFSSISVIFTESVSFHAARQRVSERLAQLGDKLPSGVIPQLAPEALATGQIFWYTVEGAGYDLGHLRALQDWYVRPQLASVPGVAEVASVGGYPIEFQIEVNPTRLLMHGVTLDDVAHAVSHSNSATGSHVVQQANAEYIVRGLGWLGIGNGSGEEFEWKRALRDLEGTVVRPAASSSSSSILAESSTDASPSAPIRVSDVATVSLGGRPRRGVLEKDGSEMTGGVVLMRYGENPLEITQRIKAKIAQLQPGLPQGIRIVPGYDRTPLIKGAISTVTRTLIEAMATASICVLLVLRHFRTSFVIAITLPLATLASFLIMGLLRHFGVVDIQTNIMSLAGIAISIGVLVDSSIVMAENVMHSLKQHFGDRPVRGDIRAIVLPACLTVGRPIFFSVMVMLISFVPVFALGGMEGKMFRPLAFTKSLALLAVAVFAITLVPALCTLFIKGRLRGENESWVVRSFSEVYRPVLNYLLDKPAALAWIMSVTFILGLAPVGIRPIFLAAVFVAIMVCGLTTASWRSRIAAIASLLLISLVADQNMKPLGREFIAPLDEGMVMDMPITVPRASINQSADDLKARDMILCRFPEVEMVMGKAGRAETATDPAPMDMIETMVSFRPAELWPRRRLAAADAARQCRRTLDALLSRGLIDAPRDPAQTQALADEAVMHALPLFDNVLRECAFLKNQEFTEELARSLIRFTTERTCDLLYRAGNLRRRPVEADIASIASQFTTETIKWLTTAPQLEDTSTVVRQTVQELQRLQLVRPDCDPLVDRSGAWNRPWDVPGSLLGRRIPTLFERVHEDVLARHRATWRGHLHQLNGELLARAPMTFTRLITDQLLSRSTIKDTGLAKIVAERKKARLQPPVVKLPKGGHHGSTAAQPAADPYPPLDELHAELAETFAKRLLLWPHERSTLAGFGSEMDRTLQMPGWTNVWTMPIQNRVDMLATGVNTAVGVRVLGGNLDEVVAASDQIAALLKRVPGAADVVADPIRGKGYLQVRPDRDRLARYAMNVDDVNQVVETALGGKIVTTVMAGRERYGVRVRYARDWRTDSDAVKAVLVAARDEAAVDVPRGPEPSAADRRRGNQSGGHQPIQVPLEQVADVQVAEGPATIKSENGLLRNYVRLNVHGRGVVDFVEEAKRVVAEQAKLPEGVFVEWTGQFEHQMRARNTLIIVMPIVITLIFLILYLTYRDRADAAIVMLAVPGALAGGVFFQWLFGYKFSVTVWIGYIACFGMATATGIIMLVYLREAVEKAGGLAHMTLAGLRQAVMDGAVQRLRPKLLTEGTTIISLAPMLWASGTGAEVIRPMAAPVLGGILIADEVIDLFLPVLFYWVRRSRWHRLHSTAPSISDNPAAIRDRAEIPDQPMCVGLEGSFHGVPADGPTMKG